MGAFCLQASLHRAASHQKRAGRHGALWPVSSVADYIRLHCSRHTSALQDRLAVSDHGRRPSHDECQRQTHSDIAPKVPRSLSPHAHWHTAAKQLAWAVGLAQLCPAKYIQECPDV